MHGPVFMAARYHRWFLISTAPVFSLLSFHSNTLKYVYMHYLTHCTRKGYERERKWLGNGARASLASTRGDMNINNNTPASSEKQILE